MVRKQRLERVRVGASRNGKKTLVHDQQRADVLTSRRDPKKQRVRHGAPRWVVRVAEHHRVRIRRDRGQKILRQQKPVLFPQRVGNDLRAGRSCCVRILRKRRNGQEHALGTQKQERPPDELAAPLPQRIHSLGTRSNADSCSVSLRHKGSGYAPSARPARRYAATADGAGPSGLTLTEKSRGFLP